MVKSTKKNIMREFEISEISGVDRPAQKGALAMIMKRDDSDIEKNGAVMTTEVDGHAHIFAVIAEGGDTIKAGVTGHSMDHGHPWLMLDNGDIVIGAMNGHTHEVSVSNMKSEDKAETKETEEANEFGPEYVKSLVDAIDWTDEMAKEAQHIQTLAKRADAMDLLASEEGALADLLKNMASKTKTKIGKKEVTDMTKENKDAEALVELQKKLDRSEAMASMNDAMKAYFMGLKGDAADKFLEMSAADRKAAMDKVAKAAEDKNPVVYTTADGIDIHKADGAAMAALAKKADLLEKANAGLLAEATNVDLEKRAAELTNIPGTLETRVAMLKAFDGIEDEAIRKAATEGLFAQNDKLAAAFETIGKQGGAVVIPGSVDEQLDQLTKAYMEKNGTSEALAMDAVLKTAEGQQLYAKSIN